MNTPLSEPRALASLADYQSGAVVSRVIFRGEGGTMTLFAFAEGEGLDEHTNPNNAIVQILEGSARVVVDGAEYTLEAGEAIHLPPSVPHALPGGAPYKMLLTLLKRSREG